MEIIKSQICIIILLGSVYFDKFFLSFFLVFKVNIRQQDEIFHHLFLFLLKKLPWTLKNSSYVYVLNV